MHAWEHIKQKLVVKYPAVVENHGGRKAPVGLVKAPPVPRIG
jgi:hypothetical protein